MFDIIYGEINRFRDARADKEKQKEIARQMVRKALLQFTFDWDSFRKSEKMGGHYEAGDSMLEAYANLFIDVAVEVNEIFPEDIINSLRDIATEMRKVANSVKGMGKEIYDEYNSMGDKCAQKALELSKKFLK